MKRREVLKTLALSGAVAALLPACVADTKKVSLALNNLDVNEDDLAMLAALAETIIPETDQPGARSVGADVFTLVMVDDCAGAETRAKFMSGLRSFDRQCKELAGKRFLAADADERADILRAIDKKGDELPEDIRTFWRMTRNYIRQGYVTSEYFLTKVKPHVHVPGPAYKGCIPLTANPA